MKTPRAVFNLVWDSINLTWSRQTAAEALGATSVDIASDSVGLARQAQLPATLGQKTMVNSLAIAIASDQSAIPVNAYQAGAWSLVDITGTISLPTGASTSALQTAGNASLTSVDSKIVTCDTSAVTITSSALPSGAATESTLSAINTKIPAAPSTDRTTAAAPFSARLTDGTAFYKATTPSDTQPISATSLPLPTGAATASNQSTANASLSSLDSKIIACDTDNVAITSSALPSGASTSALQTAGNSSLSSIDGKITTCDTGNTTIVSSALPTGAATSALQTTGNSSLSSLDSKFSTLGQKTASNSTPVVLASDVTVNTVRVPGTLATYSASVTNLATATTATDIFTLTGSASKTIRVHSITLSGNQGANTHVTFVVLKRNSANTGGTSTTQTAVPYDSTSLAATATCRAYTANPTTGTLVGNIGSYRVYLDDGNATSTQTQILYGTGQANTPVLRGTGEVLAINLNGVTVNSPLLNITIEWTEE